MLAHSKHLDLLGGHGLPVQVPFNGNNTAELESVQIGARLESCPCISFEKGIHWEIVHSDDYTDHSAVLGIPIKILSSEYELILSVKCYESLVGDENVKLNKASGPEYLTSDKKVPFCLNGKNFNDLKNCTSDGCFDSESIQLSARVPEAENELSFNDRISSEVSAVRSLKCDWIDLKDHTDEIEEVECCLLQAFSIVLEKTAELQILESRCCSQSTRLRISFGTSPQNLLPALQTRPGWKPSRQRWQVFPRQVHAQPKQNAQLGERYTSLNEPTSTSQMKWRTSLRH